MGSVFHSQGGEGLIFLPTGEDMWFTGRVFCSSVAISCGLQSVESMGRPMHRIMGNATVEVQATCVGVPNIQAGKPELVSDLSINELLRRINRRLEERG